MNKPRATRTLRNKVIAGSSTRPTVRVLHVINGEHYSGAERVQDLLGGRLPDYGFAAGFACLKPGRFATERQSTGCPLYDVPMRGKFDWRVVARLCDVVNSGDYELLHAHTPRTLLIASQVSKRSGRPLVYHVHSPVGRDSTRSLSNRINCWVESWSARRVNHFVCVSASLRDYMIDLGHPAKLLTTVPNGVAVVEEVPDRAAPAGTWTIGTTALFRPRKGIEVLLQALAELRKSGHDVRLLAVGPFESEMYQQKILALADELGVSDLIEWTGFTGDVPAQLRRMDVFVLPSLFGEGLPMVVLEAMASGVPVVAASVEGIPQAVRHGIEGLLFTPGDAGELAARVRQLVDGAVSWSSLRDSALERQRTSFSDVSMAEGVATVYEKVLDESTGRGR